MVMAAKSLDETLEILMDFATRYHRTTGLAQMWIELDKPLSAKNAGDLVELAKQVPAVNCEMSLYGREFQKRKQHFWVDKTLMISDIENFKDHGGWETEVTHVGICEMQRIR